MPLHRILQVPNFDEGLRTVRVYLPHAYHQHPHARFPVAYLQDGQNMFAGTEGGTPEHWCVDQVAEGLTREGQIPAWILVGVDHAIDRLGEYSGWDYPRAHVRAKGEQYAQWLRGLKARIDAEYRTVADPRWTATVGSSMGGFISLYLALRHGDAFGRIGAFSPTVMWSDARIFEEWRAHTRQWTRLYLDAGEHEVLHLDGLTLDYGRDTRRFHEHLRRLGYGDHELMLVLEPGGQHSEVDWRRRLPHALRWLLR